MAALDPHPSAAARRAPPRLPWPLRLREWALSSLPLLLMALLALASWWLVRNAPSASEGGPGGPLRHEPDYTMQTFTLQRFTATGALRAQIEGKQLRHYPDNDSYEIDEVRVRVIDEQDGAVTHATARRALSNGPGTKVELFGDAQVRRESTDGKPPAEFFSEYLQLLLDTEQVQTDQPVRLRQGRNDIHAAGMEYEHRSGVVKLQGPMQARLDPPARRR